MENENVILHDTPEEQLCTKCKEHEAEVYEIALVLMIALFIGPIIGMLIGLFTGKKLMK